MMKQKQQNDAENFKEPFFLETYVDNLLSSSVISNKKFDEDYATKVEEVFVKTVEKLIVLLATVNETTDHLNEKFRFIQNDFTTKSILLTNNLNNITTELQKFLARIDAFQNVTNIFGKNIAIHDLAITRAKYLITLCEKFNSFLSNENNAYVIPSEFDKILNLFEILQTLKKVAEIIKLPEYHETADSIISLYTNVESTIHNDFIAAFESQNIPKMKRILQSVVNNQTMQSFYNTFIERFQKVFENEDLFQTQPSAFSRFSIVCREAFQSEYKFLMNLYLQKLYCGALKTLCQSRLENNNIDFVQNLSDIYSKCVNMQKHMCNLNLDFDISSIEYHQKLIFSPYLMKYFDFELKYINTSFTTISHDVLIAKTMSIQDAGLSMIHISKNAHKRSQMLSVRINTAEDATRIFELLINKLIHNIISTELDSNLKELTLSSTKTDLDVNFFEFIDQITHNVHMVVKYFNEFVVPATTSSTHFDNATVVLKNALSTIETKVDTCLDKFINMSVSISKSIIASKLQYKSQVYMSDETTQLEDINKVSKTLKKFNSSIKSHLSPSNYRSFGMEFAMRFCRFLIQHYKEFTFSEAGAMIVLLDVREFQTSFSPYNVKEINDAFDLIYALMNLLIVPAEDVRQVAKGDNLKKIDPQLLQAYVEKRRDYKISNIGRIDK